VKKKIKTKPLNTFSSTDKKQSSRYPGVWVVGDCFSPNDISELRRPKNVKLCIKVVSSTRTMSVLRFLEKVFYLWPNLQDGQNSPPSLFCHLWTSVRRGTIYLYINAENKQMDLLHETASLQSVDYSVQYTAQSTTYHHTTSNKTSTFGNSEQIFFFAFSSFRRLQPLLSNLSGLLARCYTVHTTRSLDVAEKPPDDCAVESCHLLNDCDLMTGFGDSQISSWQHTGLISWLLPPPLPLDAAIRGIP